MLAIGVGLMSAPELLMLDEPTLGLAPKLKDEFREAISVISRSGVPLVLVEQDVEFRSDRDNFYLRIERWAYVDGELLRERSWAEVFPRDYQ